MGILENQVEYYRARAAEYDEWFLRQGRYDRGEEATARWQKAVAGVRNGLDRFTPSGQVLEIACGTGNWTGQLASHADRVVAIDAAPEMVEIARTKVHASNVEFHVADVFECQFDQRFDAIFFGFWLTHVPANLFDDFWGKIHRLLRNSHDPVRKGRAFLVDSLPNPESQAGNHPRLNASAERQIRLLNDGRQFEIIKRYYGPDELSDRLRLLGWTTRLETAEELFLYGTVQL